MPQPDAVNAAADPVLALLQASQARLTVEQTRFVGTLEEAARRRKVRELLAAVDREIVAIESGMKAFYDDTIPAVYATGGADTALTGEWSWNTIHRGAVADIAAQGYDEVLDATTFMRADAKRWVRDTGKLMAARSVIEGATPEQVARQLAAAAPNLFNLDGPIPFKGVVYADGTRRTMLDYSRMLMRTHTAHAYNFGALNTMTSVGVGWVEVADGADCGLTHHGDSFKPNGKVIKTDVAYQYPIAHPQCRRSFLPRVDVTSDDDAADAVSLVDPDSAAAQAAEERRRWPGAEAAGKRGRAPRTDRTPRGTGRTPRTPRNAEPVQGPVRP